jgi:hypothetical protein
MKCAYCSSEMPKKTSDDGFKVEYEKTCASCGGKFDGEWWNRVGSPSAKPAPGYTTTFSANTGKTTVTDENGKEIHVF